MSVTLPSNWISCSQFSPLPYSSPDISPKCVQFSKLVRSKSLGSKCSIVSFDEITSEEDAFEYYEPPSTTSSDSCTAMEDFVMDITMDLAPIPSNSKSNYTFLQSPPSTIASSRVLKSTNRRKSPPPSIYTGSQPRRPVSYHRSSSSPNISVHRSPSFVVVKPKTSTKSPTTPSAPKSPLLVKVQINRSSPFSLPPNTFLPISTIIISKTPIYQSFNHHHQSKNYNEVDLSSRRPKSNKNSANKIFSDEELEIFDRELNRFFGGSLPHPLPPFKGCKYPNLDGTQDLLRCKSLGIGKKGSGNFKSDSWRETTKVDYDGFEGEDWDTSVLVEEAELRLIDSRLRSGNQSVLGSKLKF